MSDSKYVFDGTGHESELDRLRLLESVFDPGSQRALLGAGLTVGMRCLEIGAGAGSVARWMGDVVGTKGSVAAVDISTRFLRGCPTEGPEEIQLGARRRSMRRAMHS